MASFTEGVLTKDQADQMGAEHSAKNADRRD